MTPVPHLRPPPRRTGAPLPPAGRILRTIEEAPGLSIEEVADGVGLSRGTVRYHIDRLATDRLEAVQRQGNHRLHFPCPCPLEPLLGKMAFGAAAPS